MSSELFTDENVAFTPTKNRFDAMQQAQEIAFGPVNFMIAMSLRRMGVLQALYEHPAGLDRSSIMTRCELSDYAAELLLESALAMKVIIQKDHLYTLSKLGHILHRDPITQVNLDFINDVCYLGLFKLEQSLRQGVPAGLSYISDKATVYEGLSTLDQQCQKSWFDFDHYYSDSAFLAALPFITSKEKSIKLLDIGGNTGKFSKAALKYNSHLQVTLADLPQQIAMASQNLKEFSTRVQFYPCNVLQSPLVFAKGFDVVWMSQFLVCFDVETIKKIFSAAAASLCDDGFVYVLDTFWDRQKNHIAAYCLIQTSPYFTTIANGNSKMYRSDQIVQYAQQAGLELIEIVDEIGISHSLMKFKSNYSGACSGNSQKPC